ncbi:MAG: MaoC family dehydratase N-terminal domain-containing protein [Actinobacteria bacterium]|nr:MaoC family dehydratase N-terminal domain-containing protein [Actinomycetota bacterium]
MAAKVSFDSVNVGDEVFSESKVVERENVKAYADASGDQNPLHQDDAYAQSVGFPGIIGHGMYSMAHLTNSLSGWVGDPGAIKLVKVQFRAVVYMGETLTAKGRVSAKDEATKQVTLELWEELERDGEAQNPIKNSTAVVQLT